MDRESNKAAGLSNEAIGDAKHIGKVIGTEKLQAAGKVQEIKAEGQKTPGDARAAVKNGTDATVGFSHRKL